MSWSRWRSAVAALLLAACASGPQLDGTRWVAQAIDMKPVLEGSAPTLDFGDDGRVAGRGGCNRYAGPAARSGETIRFGPLASTKMACMEGERTAQEQRFFIALEAARTLRIDPPRMLVLVDEAGVERVRFAPAP